MGLDMYLYVKQDKTATLDEAVAKDRLWWEGAELNGETHRFENDVMEPGLIGVAYWRKANAIHGWFDEKVGGIEDCEYYEISQEDLADLLDTCHQVRESIELIEGEIVNGYDGHGNPIIEQGTYIKDTSVCIDLLPVTQGFFFGSYEYDQWYAQDIDDSIMQLTKALEEHTDPTFIYYASW